jgi:hypothetical protein
MPDGTLVVPLPDAIMPGPHRVVVVIEEALSAEEPSGVDREAEAERLADLFVASVTTETPCWQATQLAVPASTRIIPEHEVSCRQQRAPALRGSA